MVNGVGNVGIGKVAANNASPASGAGAGAAKGSSFADILGKSIDEVSKLQQDASKAVQDAVTGKTDDVPGVMTAMEKSDLAFKTLLAIRSKLMEAYEEVKNMSV